LKKHCKTLFKKNEWKFLHSEWRFLHSIFFRNVLFVFFFKDIFSDSIQNGDFSIQTFLKKRFELFLKFVSLFFPQHFLHSEWKNLHSEWKFLHSNFFRSVSNLSFLKHLYMCFFEAFSPFRMEKSPTKKRGWINLHSEWISIHFFENSHVCLQVVEKNCLFLNGDFSIHFLGLQISPFFSAAIFGFSPEKCRNLHSEW